MRTKSLKGFTLIELLIVIAILAVMAVMVLALINPKEQLSRANDSGRISSVIQLGHQMQSYYTSNEGKYPAETAWGQTIVENNNLGSFPPGIKYIESNGITNCTTNAEPADMPSFCYATDEVNISYGVLVFSKLEAQNQRKKCNVSGETPYFVYSTSDGRGGVVCLNADPVPWEPGSQTYLD